MQDLSVTDRSSAFGTRSRLAEVARSRLQAYAEDRGQLARHGQASWEAGSQKAWASGKFWTQTLDNRVRGCSYTCPRVA